MTSRTRFPIRRAAALALAVAAFAAPAAQARLDPGVQRPAEPAQVPAGANGSDWRDLGLGAGAGIALSLLGFGTLRASRHLRPADA